MTTPNVSGEVARVAFKAPPFWESDPELWFFQIEAQFNIANITVDTTKFNSVVASLDTKVLSCVRDVIQTPPAEDAYLTLKKRILAQYSRSESARLKLLLQDLQLGDKRPSELFRDMQNLSNAKVGEDILRTLWLQRLPIHMQQILSTCKDSISDLVKIADKINEVSGTSGNVQAVEGDSFTNIRAEIAALTEEVKRLSRSRSRDLDNQRHGGPRSRSRNKSKCRDKEKGFCWYHFRFRSKAKNCTKPCRWSENQADHP
jgi:hypothetical protein